MSLPTVPPGKGDELRVPHFRHAKTPPTVKWDAYIAGPCHWYFCHAKGKTKPCLEKMTDGEVTCPGCDALFPIELKGYQPLYNCENGLPCFVIVSACSREIVDAYKLHAAVMVKKDRQQSDPVTILPALGAKPKFQSTLLWKHRPVDLTESLLRIWGYPELASWYNRTHGQGAAPIVLRKPSKKSNGAEFGPMTRAAAAKAEAANGTGDTFDAVNDRLRARMATAPPSTNGKHDK